MRARGIGTKSEAVRIAVEEGLERALEQPRRTDFSELRGLACGDGENPSPRFTSDDDLWS